MRDGVVGPGERAVHGETPVLLDLVAVDGRPVTPRPEREGGAVDLDDDQRPDAYFAPSLLAQWMDRIPWWHRASSTARGWVVIGAVLTIAAAGGLVGALRHQRHVVVERRPVVQVIPGGADAVGCPLSRRCLIRPASDLAAEVTKSDPTMEILHAWQVVDATDATVYRSEIYALRPTNQIRLWVVSQCLPNGETTVTDAGLPRAMSDDPQVRVYEYTQASSGMGCTAYARLTVPVEVDDQQLDWVSLMYDVAHSNAALSSR
jgi:hypothetical protein